MAPDLACALPAAGNWVAWLGVATFVAAALGSLAGGLVGAWVLRRFPG